MKVLEPDCGVWVNDEHSGLNPTCLSQLHAPSIIEELGAIVWEAAARDCAISISGGRHAMGGQQFGTGTIGLDLRGLRQILHFDRERGLLKAEAGICWPELIDGYLRRQQDDGPQWSINQKQSGADALTLGGSVSANIHGRGLGMAPIGQDIEALTVFDPNGSLVRCSRSENAVLFSAVTGGYGLFGPIATVTLRLRPRQLLRRHVQLCQIEELPDLFARRAATGFQYGDFQFSIDERSTDFLRGGIASFYCPVPASTPMRQTAKISPEMWTTLLELAYTDRSEGFRRYRDHYLSTDGQIYWSDLHQLSPYVTGFGERVRSAARRAGLSPHLMITELCVPPARLAEFMVQASRLLRRAGIPVIYGTVRIVRPDLESLLPWAQREFCTVIFNLPVPATGHGRLHAEQTFRDLIDLSLALAGTFYLTYHRFATADQIEAAHPRLSEFRAMKEEWDPTSRFRSDWWDDLSRKVTIESRDKLSPQSSHWSAHII